MNGQGYLDIHTHILPGVDDGAVDFEMTKRMLKEAYQQGTRTMVATPHSYPHKEKQNIEKITSLHAQVAELAMEIDSNFKILLGNEIYFRDGIFQEMKDGELFTMAESRYLLVEFSPREKFQRIFQGMKDLIELGYYPIIAHVERVRSLVTEEKKIDDLIELGCYLQVNCESLMGGIFDSEAKRLRKLILNRKIHFLGSDCHNLSDRPPIMSSCVEVLYKKLPKDAVDCLLYHNQQKFMEKKFI